VHLRISRQDLIISFAFAATVLATFFVFQPGLSGAFVFDDFPNLSDLGFAGGVTNWHSALRFTIGGNAGPLGRPISLASFLLNDNGWPSDPYSFKYTNLLFHILAGVALFTFLNHLSRATVGNLTSSQSYLPIIVCCAWLLNPIQTAPIFLVIQRMTILSGLFSFFGLAVWTAGRNRLLAGKSTAWLLMTIGVALGTLLATLSKENGALLPLLILVTEQTLAPLPKTPAAKTWRLVFLVLPSLLFAGYLLLEIPALAQGYSIRNFTLEQRLLIEPAILFDYLREIAIPSITTTIYHDDILVPESLTLKISTAIVAWLALLVSSVMLRRRYPQVAWGIMFFFFGHFLEAGPIPLELYFTHRNYVPMVGPLFAGIAAAAHLLNQKPKLAILLCSTYLALLASISWVSSRYWGNEPQLLMAWAEERPASIRAAETAANFWGSRGNYKNAIDIIERTLSLTPDAATLVIGDYYEHCLAGTEQLELWHRMLKLAPIASYDITVVDALDILALNIRSGSCKDISIGDIKDLLVILMNNQHYKSVAPQVRLGYALALYELELDNQTGAISALERVNSGSETVYTLELLGDLYRERGQLNKAAEAYRRATSMHYFSGWRALLYSDGPHFPELESKLRQTDNEIEQQSLKNGEH